MFKKILVPSDGSKLAHACASLEPSEGTRIFLNIATPCIEPFARRGHHLNQAAAVLGWLPGRCPLPSDAARCAASTPAARRRWPRPSARFRPACASSPGTGRWRRPCGRRRRKARAGHGRRGRSAALRPDRGGAELSRWMTGWQDRSQERWRRHSSEHGSAMPLPKRSEGALQADPQGVFGPRRCPPRAAPAAPALPASRWGARVRR